MNREPDRNQRKVLGKGLSALLPSRGATATAVAAPPPPETSLPENFEEFQSLPLDQIQPGEEQPRDVFDFEKMQELAQSIQANGILQPIVVYRDPASKGRYRIIAGERRWRAAGMAGLKEIPALVRTVEREKLLELSLIENIQREDLNPIEVANAFERLQSDHGLRHEQIAERTGKDRSTITNFLRLLKLGPRAQTELKMGNLSVGHARALLNIANEKQQAELCDEIIIKKLSVRDVEALVKRLTQQPRQPEAAEKKEEKRMDPNVRAAIEELERVLGTKVHLLQGAKGAGRLMIEYYSQDDLDRIYSAIVQ
ncbi:MAG TPA: ParB/RepB/Spo0J family partition protein [Bryobacteraceae bacterium]|jgi:ParB family chromosome partitioning protein